MGCRVYDERQLFWTAIAKGVDQDVGKSGAAKARYENGHSIRNVGESLCCGARSFVHRHRWYASLFFNQQLCLEILSVLACLPENSIRANSPVRKLQKIPRSGPQLFCWWDGTRQLGEIRMSTHLRLVRSRTRP